MRAQLAGIGSKVDSLAHTVVDVWKEEGGVVLFEVDGVWCFPDGVEITICACSIFTIAERTFTVEWWLVHLGP